jgi:hypothetical protein
MNIENRGVFAACEGVAWRVSHRSMASWHGSGVESGISGETGVAWLGGVASLKNNINVGGVSTPRRRAYRASLPITKCRHSGTVFPRRRS